MNVNNRSYTSKRVKTKGSAYYSRFHERDKFVYPEFLQFFKNLRYIVGMNFKSFNEFSRMIGLAGVRVSNSTVYGYEKGYFKTVQYNWLFFIARFLGQDVHLMLTTDFRERDDRIKLESESI